MTTRNVKPNGIQAAVRYLRTSNKDTQNPEQSQARQRDKILSRIEAYSDLPVITEYIDNESGRTRARSGYQAMLRDARAGKFSYIMVENAERFGRDLVEALQTIDELAKYNVSVTFADYPEIDPFSPSGRFQLHLFFALAERESNELSKRVSDTARTRAYQGKYNSRPPDGYRTEENLEKTMRSAKRSRRDRQIVIDPDRADVIKLLFQLWNQNQYTLDELCDEMHLRGYILRSGRPFVERNDTRRKTAANTVSKMLQQPFYAGWLVSKAFRIEYGQVRGQWEPLISEEDFQLAQEILERRRTRSADRKRRYTYLLKGLIYLEVDDDI